MSAATILRVYSYEPGTKATKQKRTLELPDASDLSKIDLKYIRGILIKNKVLDSTDVKAPFCDNVGAEVADTMTFDVYKDQLQVENKVPDEPPGDPSPFGEILKVYYKKRKKMNTMDDATTEFLKKQLDLKLQAAPELKDLRAEILASSFEASKWQASSGGTRSIAANLTERDWSVITRTNCLLSGYRLIFKDMEVEVEVEGGEEKKKEKRTIPCGVERTPFNAFNLKARVFENYEVAAPPSQAAPGKGAEILLDEELAFRIPRYRIDDTSRVNVVETKNAVESSMAESSFSNASVEASAGGGAFGVSAAVKCGYSRNDQKKSITANAESHQKIHISYEFPRVTVFLNEDSLELTSDVKEDVLKVKDEESLKAFTDKYGDIFSRKVKLGGKLTSTTEIDSSTNMSETQRENSMKAAAAASFSGAYGSGSAEASHKGGGKHADGSNKQDLSSQLTWAATGGDTTLCNDPPKWCGTVGDFYNWRVVEFDDPISLPRLISSFEGFEHVDEQFEIAAGYRDMVEEQPRRRVHTTVRLKEINSKRRLAGTSYAPPLREAIKAIDDSPYKWSDEYRILEDVKDTGVMLTQFASESHEIKKWTLETWIRSGEEAHLPHGSYSYITIHDDRPPRFKGGIPPRDFDKVPELGITSRLPKADGRGFLNLVPKGRGKLFKLQTPPTRDPKIGPIKTGDIVELSIHSKGENSWSESREWGTLMECSYPMTDAMSDYRRNRISRIKDVPGYGRRKTWDDSYEGNDVDSAYDYSDERFLQFEVEVLGSTFVD